MLALSKRFLDVDLKLTLPLKIAIKLNYYNISYLETKVIPLT